MEVSPLESTAIPSAGDEIAGKYLVEHVIGQGGMGAVFAARNTLTGKRVAIKWLLPEHAASVNRERLLREAQLAASIEHPNVVDVYDVGEHQGGLFLVMELLRGRALSDVMLEKGRLEPQELIGLLVPAMRGVHAAHMAGVIHRDLKPENIILSEVDGEIVPKVVDFGVSKATGVSALPNASLTRTGALVGTPHYMALEQVNGSAVVDPRTDVYAFGVLLYRGLTGAYPFDGSSLGEVILSIGTKEPPSLRVLRPDLPEALDAVVARALARDLHARFESLEELGQALLPFASSGTLAHSSWHGSWGSVSLHGPSVSSLQGSVPRPPPALASVTADGAVTRKRQRRVVGAAALLALLFALALLVSLDATEHQGANGPVAEEPAALAQPSSPTATAGAAHEGPSAARPRLAPPENTARELTLPSGVEAAAAGAQAVTEQGEREVEIAEPRRAKRPGALSARRESSGAQAARGSVARNRQESGAAASRKASESRLIPGTRTSGLSPEDF